MKVKTVPTKPECIGCFSDASITYSPKNSGYESRGLGINKKSARKMRVIFAKFLRSNCKKLQITVHTGRKTPEFTFMIK